MNIKQTDDLVQVGTQRASGNVDAPVAVESHTEVGRVVMEYNWIREGRNI